MSQNPEVRAQQERKARQDRALQEALAQQDEANPGYDGPARSRSTTPPGWYDHPTMVGTQRYWDGEHWTDHVAPGQRQASTPPGYSTTFVAAPPNASGATTALVLGILSLTCFGLFTGIPAMVTARRTTREIDQANGRLGGRGLATAGFVTGLIGTILSALAVLYVVFVMVLGVALQGELESTCSTINPDPITNPECFD